MSATTGNSGREEELWQVIYEQEAAVAVLAEAITTLSQRLGPILCTHSQEDPAHVEEELDRSSELGQMLESIRFRIRKEQEKVAQIITKLGI